MAIDLRQQWFEGLSQLRYATTPKRLRAVLEGETVVDTRDALLVYEPRHWKDFRAAEMERLSIYGWMDRSTGAVHVPIERAMDLIAVRGVGPLPQAPVALPAQAATPAPQPTASPEKKR